MTSPAFPYPFRPSNGSEGAIFEAHYCNRCRRDRAYRMDPDRFPGCQILAAALAFGIDEPGYPKEWVEDLRGPKCTAFEPDDQQPRRAIRRRPSRQFRMEF